MDIVSRLLFSAIFTMVAIIVGWLLYMLAQSAGAWAVVGVILTFFACFVVLTIREG